VDKGHAGGIPERSRDGFARSSTSPTRVGIRSCVRRGDPSGRPRWAWVNSPSRPRARTEPRHPSILSKPSGEGVSRSSGPTFETSGIPKATAHSVRRAGTVVFPHRCRLAAGASANVRGIGSEEPFSLSPASASNDAPAGGFEPRRSLIRRLPSGKPGGGWRTIETVVDAPPKKCVDVRFQLLQIPRCGLPPPRSLRLRRFSRPWRFDLPRTSRRVSAGRAHGVRVPDGISTGSLSIRRAEAVRPANLCADAIATRPADRQGDPASGSSRQAGACRPHRRRGWSLSRGSGPQAACCRSRHDRGPEQVVGRILNRSPAEARSRSGSSPRLQRIANRPQCRSTAPRSSVIMVCRARSILPRDRGSRAPCATLSVGR